MLYIRRLELIDENDNIVFSLRHVKASQGLIQALDICNKKDGKREIKKGFANYLRRVDNEFKEYFSLQ